jgi:hypothetical protein
LNSSIGKGQLFATNLEQEMFEKKYLRQGKDLKWYFPTQTWVMHALIGNIGQLFANIVWIELEASLPYNKNEYRTEQH